MAEISIQERQDGSVLKASSVDAQHWNQSRELFKPLSLNIKISLRKSRLHSLLRTDFLLKKPQTFQRYVNLPANHPHNSGIVPKLLSHIAL